VTNTEAAFAEWTAITGKRSEGAQIVFPTAA